MRRTINGVVVRAAGLVAGGMALCLSGCLRDRPANPAATQPVTVVDPALADRSYWLNQPASAEVSDADFDKLWAACEAVARDHFFEIDLRDYRRGVLKTQPVISKQFFEFWRHDTGTAKDTEESSLGPIQRVIYFQFTRNLDGTYTVAPKIVVERHSQVDPKYFDEVDAQGKPKPPPKYWYTLRRDTVLEGRIAEAVQDKLRG